MLEKSLIRTLTIVYIFTTNTIIKQLYAEKHSELVVTIATLIMFVLVAYVVKLNDNDTDIYLGRLMVTLCLLRKPSQLFLLFPFYSVLILNY